MLTLNTQPKDGALRGKWWKIYNDPRLDAFEDQVSISNQNVLAAAILDLFTWPIGFWSVGSQLAETLFDAGKRHVQVQLTQAAYDVTVANYR